LGSMVRLLLRPFQHLYVAQQGCKFKASYYDYEKDDFALFECQNPAVLDGLCIFHHPEYWKEHEEEVRKKFYREVEEAIKNKRALICVGYNFPTIDLSEKSFEASLYFNRAVFSGDAAFWGATFSENAYFLEATFSGKAIFRRTEFFDHVNFDYARFKGGISFNKTRFSPGFLARSIDLRKRASFHNIYFEKQEDVVFDGIDMSRLSLLYTDIDRVKFRNIKWSECTTYDEELLLIKYLKDERDKRLKLHQGDGAEEETCEDEGD